MVCALALASAAAACGGGGGAGDRANGAAVVRIEGGGAEGARPGAAGGDDRDGGGREDGDGGGTEPARRTTGDDRRTVALALPEPSDLGAGWLERRRDPEGTGDPTFPTGPEVPPECGGDRRVRETGAGHVLFERRRAGDLDEQLVAWALLFADEASARARAEAFASRAYEDGCLVGEVLEALDGVKVAVRGEDRPLPALPAGVEGHGRTLRLTTHVDGERSELVIERTVLRAGRAVGLLVRFVLPTSPQPFHVDGAVRALADGVARIGAAPAGG